MAEVLVQLDDFLAHKVAALDVAWLLIEEPLQLKLLVLVQQVLDQVQADRIDVTNLDAIALTIEDGPIKGLDHLLGGDGVLEDVAHQSYSGSCS